MYEKCIVNLSRDQIYHMFSNSTEISRSSKNRPDGPLLQIMTMKIPMLYARNNIPLRVSK